MGLGKYIPWVPMGKNKDGIDWQSRKTADGGTEYLETLPNGTIIEIDEKGNRKTVFTPPKATAPAGPALTPPAPQQPTAPVPRPAQPTTEVGVSQTFRPHAPTTDPHTTAPAAPEHFDVPSWAKDLPGWKPGDKKVTIVNQGPDESTTTYGYQDSKGDLVYQGANGTILEDPAGAKGPYVVKKADPAAQAADSPHDLPLGNTPASAPYQHSPGTSQGSPTSEHGMGSGFVSDNSPAAQPHPAADPVSEHGMGSGFMSENSPAAQPSPVPAWTQDVNRGTSIEGHGTTLASRDSRDGSKTIFQMSDGTYESVDKTSGAVGGAGTWGDGHGGGVGINGIGNPASSATSTAPAAPQPNTSYDVGGTMVSPPAQPSPPAVVTSNMPTLPPSDATTSPPPSISALDPSASAAPAPRNFHQGHMLEIE